MAVIFKNVTNLAESLGLYADRPSADCINIRTPKRAPGSTILYVAHTVREAWSWLCGYKNARDECRREFKEVMELAADYEEVKELAADYRLIRGSTLQTMEEKQ